ncbi:MAG: hypothetical protein GY807_14820 [Gammaproteobacteria bacterium]|nr:hypothetical protein [Gammaproteobacteria bacterium]
MKPSILDIAFIFLISILICSCSTTVVLPENDSPTTKMYLLKYTTWGHHSLAFYQEGKLIEYTFGDWELFALNKRDGWTAWKNMTFLTQGALGKKVVSWSPGQPICENFRDCDVAVAFQAPEEKVTELFIKLQRIYAENSDSEIFNQEEGIYFVKYDKSYWSFHNCNHEIADWLEQLGGEVSGKIFYEPDFVGGMTPKQDLSK